MSRSFEIPIDEPIEAILVRVQDAVLQAGGNFRGDVTRGSFSGSGVEGDYRVEGASIQVNLSKKPWVVSWAYVEGEIRSFFTG